jgi:5-methylcytosine-specific restriction endonuclease McrA
MIQTAIRPLRIDKKLTKWILWCACPHRCHYCDRRLKLKTATIDHMKSRASGGSDDPVNLRIACLRCNAKKGQSTYLGFVSRTTSENRTNQMALQQGAQP